MYNYTDIDISDIHLVDKKYPRKYPQTLIQNAQVQTTLVHFLDEEQRFIHFMYRISQSHLAVFCIVAI